MPTREGIVTAKSQFGIMLDHEDMWFNWSKNEEAQPALKDKDIVKKLDAVVIEHEGKYVNSLEIVSPSQDVTPEATRSPSGEGTDRDRHITRQTCIKAASMALQHGMGTPEEKAGAITYLAGVLEDWVYR